jgi:hypothetical protein
LLLFNGLFTLTAAAQKEEINICKKTAPNPSWQEGLGDSSADLKKLVGAS